MYAQYIKEYKDHEVRFGPNTAIFMLVGSFYELYDIPDEDGEYQTSMKRAIDILGIANVEKRGDAPGGKNGRFGGFGVAQLHKYAAMLTRENWTVVIIDQQKDEKGKVIGRKVTRILSPGTHVEASQTENFYLTGLWLDAGNWTDQRVAPRFGVTALDLTTGAVKIFDGAANGRPDSWSSDTLLHFFQVHPPKELVIWWRGATIDTPLEQQLRRILGVPTAKIHIYNGQDQGGLEKHSVRDDLLRHCFKPKSLLPLKEVLRLRDYTERSTTSLLGFTQEHFPTAIEYLHIPVEWNPSDSVYLGNHALTQLNMITAKEDDSVLAIFMKTATQMGRRVMRQRLLYPIADPVKLESLYKEVEWSKTETGALRFLKQMKDLARLHRRITLASVTANDILDLEQSYESARRIAIQVAEGPLSLPAKLASEFESYLADFLRVFDVEKARRASENQFCLTEEAGPRSAAIESHIIAAHEEINRIFKEFEGWAGVEGSIRMEQKEASILINGGKGVMKTITEKLKQQVPYTFQGAVVHAKKSSSSLEIPQLNSLYGKILRFREDLQTTIKEELPSVCDKLTSSHIETWDALEAWIAQIDVSITIGQVANERGYCRPHIVRGEAASIEAIGLRHPLIESQQTRLEYVKHDVKLGVDSTQGWLVYGMNASGKSSLMKATGIAVLLAQCGCYVPATEFRINPFRSLFTRILSTDNLWAGLSSFAVEMTELVEVLRRANPWSLVLGDEVCSGTESLSAKSIVGVTLEWLERHGSRFIFATHLHGLPTKSLTSTKVWHLRVQHDPVNDVLTYDRTLHPGPGSSLYGLEVAKAMGAPMEFLVRAHKMRRNLIGEETAETAPMSEWNTSIQRRACEVCGATMVRDLEVHHIQPRADAIGGRLPDGSNMNNQRNLVVVCKECHDKHHAGEIEIGSVKQTSEGPQREIHRTPKAPTTVSEEQLETIKSALKAYPQMTPTRMIVYLQQHHEIITTPQRLKAIREKM
jgi:DNA mismatch repair protein MutS